jgi:hypothetical protein
MSASTPPDIQDRWAAAGALASLLIEKGLSEISLDDLPDHRDALEGLVADGVLQRRDDDVRFFHDRYADYVFARTFTEQGKLLVDLLSGVEQDLERRPQVHQVVEYQREIDRSLYEETVARLLHEEKIRFHIKDVVFSVLRDDEEPTDATWETIQPFVEDSERMEHRAAWRVACQPAWFRYLDDHRVLDGWIGSDDEGLRNQATNLLRAAIDEESSRVAARLTPLLEAGGDWPKRVQWIIEFSRVDAERSLVDLALRLLRLGLYDDQPERLWHTVHKLEDRNPDWACDVLAALLERGYVRGEERDEDPFKAELFASSGGGEEFLDALAQARPAAVVELLVPAIIRSARAAAIAKHEDGPIFDSIWRIRYPQNVGNFEDTVLGAAERAAALLAEADPSALDALLTPLVDSIDFATPRFLLYRAWAANGEAFSDKAVEALLAGTDRLESGYAGSNYWATRELIQAASPACEKNLFNALEVMLLDFVPESERSEAAEVWRGQAQWVLLSGLDQARRSEAANDRINELGARFDVSVEELAPRARFRGGFVGSPISTEDATTMTDDEWREAILRYHSERRDWSDTGPVGGALEVSRTLETVTKLQPDRFASLGISLPDEANDVYFEALLRGLADSERDPTPGVVFDFMRRCHALPGRPYGRWIGSPLSKVVSAEINDDIFEIVAWYALKDPDPREGDWRPEQGEIESGGGDILTAGINSVRGTSAQTISVLIFNHEERVGPLLEALEGLSRDRALSVRACAAETLSILSRHDKARATALFMELIDTDGDELLRAQTIENFLGYRASEEWNPLGAVVERMVMSQVPEVSQAGARRAAICSLHVPEAEQLVELALFGAEPLRKGVAQVAAANVGTEQFREPCEAWLMRLFDDEAREVRDAAGDWARETEPRDLERLADLAIVFMNSRAYGEDPTFMLTRLEETRAAVPELMLIAAERFAAVSGAAAADISKGAAADAPHASNLAMRAYSSTADKALRARALDVIDELLALGVPAMAENISAFDKG